MERPAVAEEGIVVVEGFDRFEGQERRIRRTVVVVPGQKPEKYKRTIISVDDLIDRESEELKRFSRKATGNPHGFMRSRTTRGLLVYIRHCFHQEMLGFDKGKKLELKQQTHSQDCGILMGSSRGGLNSIIHGEVLHFGGSENDILVWFLDGWDVLLWRPIAQIVNGNVNPIDRLGNGHTVASRFP